MIIAIDPGASGGIAISTKTGAVKSFPMPDGDTEVLDLLKAIPEKYRENFDEKVIVTMEQVGGYVGGGGQPGSAMFKFGYGNGVIVGACLALGYSLDMVRPQKWQKELSLGTRDKAMTKPEWKRKLKEVAQKLYPEIKVTLGTADALLILTYALRINRRGV